MSTRHPYRNPALSPGQRAQDLLGRMTLEDKVGQLMQLDGRQKNHDELIRHYRVGSLLHLNGSDANAAIKAATETPLGIPLLMADDGIHGHSFWAGATIFPTQLAMASSWNPDLLEAVARVTAREMSATGLRWTFSPVLCLARDLRWGRVGETFGEDPYLIGEMACAMIRGYQGKGLDDPEGVLATAKHYAGYSDTLGGRDASEADITRRRLRSYFLPPFEKAARSGCMAFMTGYQAMDGVPSTANRWLLREVLKEEWGFRGVLVTDWNTVGTLVTDQKICADLAEAAALAISSGNDLIMATPGFFEGALEAVSRGLLTVAEIDEVVLRLLELKFRLGLFENPGYSDPQAIRERIACREHAALNLRVARESLVLLQNDGLLPLTGAKKVTVLGPLANDPVAQLGDWSLGSGQMDGANGQAHPREAVCTVLDGLQRVAPAGSQVTWVPGCSATSDDESGIGVALEACIGADLVVLVLGDTINFIGECRSTATLEPQGGQQALARAVMARCRQLGVPVVTVLVNSKPLVLPKEVHGSNAIFEAFNPGMAGGQAIAEALWGVINPQGRLTISLPWHVGQLPVWYNQTRGQHGDRYADLTQEPAWVFGHGLGYTTFALTALELASAPARLADSATPVRVRARVRNTGRRSGVTVLQAYVEDCVTSLTWATKELQAFARLELAAGEERVADLEIPWSGLSLVVADGSRQVEAGEFRIHVGFSSRPADLQTLAFTLDK